MMRYSEKNAPRACVVIVFVLLPSHIKIDYAQHV